MKRLFALTFSFAALTTAAQVFDITSYGAVGNGTTLNTAAIQQAVDACNAAGGGTVKVPAGTFLTSTVYLKSNVTLHLDSGATIKGAPNTTDYIDVIPQVRSYTDNYPQRSVFYAEGQHNITIEGEGTFDGNGQSISFLLDGDNKPYGFRFFSCTNIRYEGIKMLNSGFWMMHNFNVDTLVMKNLYIVNQNFGNGDGINGDGCRNVIVDSCFADCNDDPIVFKTTSLYPCRNVSVTNCTVATYSRAIKLGTETNGAFENIYFNNITVQLSTLGPFPNNPAKCGINFSIVDGGSMENVLLENVSMTGIKAPLVIRLGNRARKYTDTATAPGVGTLRNVELSNITATASTNLSSSVTGIPGYYATDIRLSDIDITYPGGWAALDSSFTVPENISSGPEADIFGDTLPASGIFIRHVDGIQLHNICFHAQQPDGRPELIFNDVINSGNLLNTDSMQNCFATPVKEVEATTLSMFPNPFTDDVTLSGVDFTDGKSYTVEVTNMSGKVVFSQFIARPTVKFQQLLPGMYFLRLTNGSNTLTRKIIKL